MSSERQELNSKNPWWGEHVFRYREVSRFIGKDFRILDIACGNGFGSYILASYPNTRVTGADLDKDSIEFCKKTWNAPNLDFIVANATQLSFPNGHFDLIVSFETIEHTTQYREMLIELKRVLKPEGILVLSTPNKPINSPTGIVLNPYHTQEFEYDELIKLLLSFFPKVQLSGQQYCRYKNKKDLSHFLARITERFFYMRGIRKLPVSFQDSIMKLIIGKQQYPIPEDYCLVTDVADIKSCKTFFAVCRK